MKYLLLPILFLSSCSNVNGVFDIQEGDCSMFQGEAEYHGRATESSVDGRAYVRRGACDELDRAAYSAAVKA